MPVNIESTRILLANLIKLRDAAGDRGDVALYCSLDLEVQALQKGLASLN